MRDLQILKSNKLVNINSHVDMSSFDNFINYTHFSMAHL